jgi:hypothetical protein
MTYLDQATTDLFYFLSFLIMLFFLVDISLNIIAGFLNKITKA